MTLPPSAEPSPIVSRRVVIIQRLLPHYRLAVFVGLHQALAKSGIALTVAAGKPRPGEAFATEEPNAAWFRPLHNRYAGPIYWQSVGVLAARSDLVVMEHANAPLANHLLVAARLLGRRRPLLAYWGHGDDLQHGNPTALRRRIKRLAINFVDHYFVYTEGSRERVVAAGFPAKRVTVLGNSIAVPAVPHLDTAGRAATRRTLGLPETGPVALFCARLMENKNIPFLIDSAVAAQARVPNLSLVIIGDGPLAGLVGGTAARHGWIRAVGARYGADKAAYFATADFFLLPSMVGLSILDAFSAGLPVLAADFGNHSPEVEYLEPGVNGLMTAPTVEAYADAIATLAGNSGLCARFAEMARQTAERYSLANMIGNFARGIESCTLGSKDSPI